MPPTAWNVQKIDADGVVVTNQAIDSTNGNKFPNNGRIRVRLRGAASATGTVTFGQRDDKCSQGIVHAAATVTNQLDSATKRAEFGPFPIDFFNDFNGDVIVTYSGTVAGITANVTEHGTVL